MNTGQSRKESLVYWWVIITPCLCWESHLELREGRWHDGKRPKLSSSLSANFVPMTLKLTLQGARFPTYEMG